MGLGFIGNFYKFEKKEWDKKGNLYQFHWGEDDTFYIIKPKTLKRNIANINNYEILHIGFESDSMYEGESCQ